MGVYTAYHIEVFPMISSNHSFHSLNVYIHPAIKYLSCSIHIHVFSTILLLKPVFFHLHSHSFSTHLPVSSDCQGFSPHLLAILFLCGAQVEHRSSSPLFLLFSTRYKENPLTFLFSRLLSKLFFGSFIIEHF